MAFFRGDAAFALPDLYEFLEAEGYKYTIRLKANTILQEPVAHLLKRPVGRPPNHVQRFHASRAGSWDKKRRVVAKVEWYPTTLSSCRLHRDQPNPTGQARGRLLQSARHGGAAHQGRQERDCVDPTVVQEVPQLRGSTSPSCAGLQSHQLNAHPGSAGAVKHWSLTSLRQKLVKIGARIVGHGRYVTFQMAEVAVPRSLFDEILRLIAQLRAPPAPA